ncbi:hypothetical protein PIB30_098669, partial [Stylosanthes scabra]|nr:hypothetical protein [Stylosanthes scabra]
MGNMLLCGCLGDVMVRNDNNFRGKILQNCKVISLVIAKVELWSQDLNIRKGNLKGTNSSEVGAMG